jgi:hypothetical protein
VDEVRAVRQGRAAAIRDATQLRQEVTGLRTAREGEVYAVPIAADGQRPGNQVAPSRRPGAKPRLGVVEPQQVRQQPGH